MPKSDEVIIYKLFICKNLQWGLYRTECYPEGKHYTSVVSSYWFCRKSEVDKCQGYYAYLSNKDLIPKFKQKILKHALKDIPKKRAKLMKTFQEDSAKIESDEATFKEMLSNLKEKLNA